MNTYMIRTGLLAARLGIGAYEAEVLPDLGEHEIVIEIHPAREHLHAYAYACIPYAYAYTCTCMYPVLFCIYTCTLKTVPCLWVICFGLGHAIIHIYIYVCLCVCACAHHAIGLCHDAPSLFDGSHVDLVVHVQAAHVPS